MTANYILDGKVPVKEDDLLKWARWFKEEHRRRVALTVLIASTAPDDVEVSTMFWGYGPTLFETMVLGGDHDGFIRHYSTWEEAEAGHVAIVEMIREGDHALDE